MGTSANLYIRNNGKLLMTKFVHFDGYKEFTGTKILEFLIKYQNNLDIFKDIEIEEFDMALYDKIMEKYYDIQTSSKDSMFNPIMEAKMYFIENIVSPLMIPSSTVSDFFNFVVSVRPRVLQDIRGEDMYSNNEYTIDIGKKTYTYIGSEGETEIIPFSEITEDNISKLNDKGYSIGSMPTIFPYIKL